MSIQGFGNSIRGVTHAAKFYYKKELEELTEKEVLELIIIPIAPSYYSPIKNQKRLDNVVNNIMKN